MLEMDVVFDNCARNVKYPYSYSSYALSLDCVLQV